MWTLDFFLFSFCLTAFGRYFTHLATVCDSFSGLWFRIQNYHYNMLCKRRASRDSWVRNTVNLWGFNQLQMYPFSFIKELLLFNNCSTGCSECICAPCLSDLHSLSVTEAITLEIFAILCVFWCSNFVDKDLRRVSSWGHCPAGDLWNAHKAPLFKLNKPCQPFLLHYKLLKAWSNASMWHVFFCLRRFQGSCLEKIITFVRVNMIFIFSVTHITFVLLNHMYLLWL